ncbi:MAG: cation-translocating P-type ATPase [Candidatus Diapherotrites archaeon]
MSLENAHALNFKDVMKALGVKKEGLEQKEAEKRLLEFGENKLPEKEGSGILKILISQFRSFLVYVLIFAIVLYVLIGDYTGALVIGVIVILNALLGLFQEFKSEKAMDALKKMAIQKAFVIRSGIKKVINSEELVPGDIIIVSEGDKIPADVRIIESINLQVNESMLTGESIPVRKVTETQKEKIQISERINMLHMGTVVTYGRGQAVVVNTGLKTEIGKIAEMLHKEDETKTPLSIEIDKLGKVLGILIIGIIFALSLIVFISGKFTINTLESAIALAVAAIPEGLPAVLTITLALGMHRMAKQNAIVRKILAVETLGSVSVICADKTGTITKSELSVREIFLGNNFFRAEEEGIPETNEKEMILKNCVLCNNAEIGEDNIGDPTEIALLKFAESENFQKAEFLKEYKFIEEVPFSSERKKMSVVFEKEKKQYVFMKGAIESVLKDCKKISVNGNVVELSEKNKIELLENNKRMAKNGLRVLAFAYKEHKENEKYEQNLIFTGLVGMIDAPRPEVKKAIEKCRLAGIDVKMITGDHELTALAVAKEVGIFRENSLHVTGNQLDEMSDDELFKKIENISVFARVNPEHKVRIVNALRKKGKVIAMTGDGVNDAPALQEADIGIAMGITGTDVSKGAADVVIMDDNFATIVKAIEGGRKIYSNIKSFIRYLLTANTGEVFVIGFATLVNALFFDFPLPLLPIQILWVNLVTDGIPALALSREGLDKSEMHRPPRPKNETLLHKMPAFILVGGLLTGISTLIAFLIGFSTNYETALTMALTTLILFELILVFNCRSEDKTVFEMPLFSNKILVLAVTGSFLVHLIVMYVPMFADAMKIVPLTGEWLVVILLSLPALIVPYISRIFER